MNLRLLIDSLASSRKKQKITLKELAEKTGISVKHLSKIENHKVNPTIEIVERIAEGLDLKIDIKTEEKTTA